MTWRRGTSWAGASTTATSSTPTSLAWFGCTPPSAPPSAGARRRWAVDVAVVATTIGLLVCLLPLSSAGRLWAVLALFGLYFSTTEGGHCQRDVWMLLPALLAVYWR